MALHAQNKIDLLLRGTSMRAYRMAVIEYTTELLRVEFKKKHVLLCSKLTKLKS